ncbi:MAG: lipopolysaccharide biosynthesis protein [Woeseiaceae bacterium]|nr:lipopolysaccharide biosynthesis protein [Woeseiaceae bacterium]
MSDIDKSGTRQLGRNVATSWLSHIVFIVLGFLMPRIIDNSLGQVALGVWDFGWTIVNYLSLAMVGIGSSINRYVARYRAANDVEKLSSTVSSVVAVQLSIATAVAIATIVLARVVPDQMDDQLGQFADDAGDVLFYLGLSLAVQMAFDASRGILTGCHRWTSYNAINAGGYAVTAFAMIAVLMTGGGLGGMAMVFFWFTLGTELLRAIYAVKACPEIMYRIGLVNWRDVRKVVAFGMKNVLIYVPRIVVQQSVSIAIVGVLGPAMLATMARPLALAGHLATVVNKFSYVLTPTAGSLQGAGRNEDLRSFAFGAMRAGWILAALPCAYLFVLGDKVVDLWMGADYANWRLMAVLAAGYLIPTATSAVLTILAGVNEHGRVAKLSLQLSIVTLLVALPLIYTFGLTLEVAAFIIVLPSNIGIGLVSIVVGCKVLNISAREYVVRVVSQPLSVAIVCAIALWVVRAYGPESSWQMLLIGAVVQLVIVLLLLQSDVKEALRSLKK